MKIMNFEQKYVFVWLFLFLITPSITIGNELNQSQFLNIDKGIAAQSNYSMKSDDLIISVEKNSTGLGLDSTLEFNVTLTNTISSLVQDVEVFANTTSTDIALLPSQSPIYQLSDIEPGTSAEFSIFANLEQEITMIPMDLAIIFDASGSMGEEISSVKSKVTDLLTNLSQEIPDFRIGIVIYGWSKYSEYPWDKPQNYIEFTSDLNMITNFVNTLYADGGTEPWGDALYMVNTWDWRPSAQKLIIMIGDEDCDHGYIVGDNPPSGDFYNGSELLQVVTNLKDKGVIINTIVTNNPDSNVQDQFQWISKYTGGESGYLPDLEAQGIDLPKLIEKWALQYSREFYHELNITVTWKDSNLNSFSNSLTEYFWLDLASPSVVISTTTTLAGLDVYNIGFIAKVVDFSPIKSVVLFHNADGFWFPINMNQIENTSIYTVELSELPSKFNLSYFVRSSDILGNIGSTPEQWIIIQPTKNIVGEEVIALAESNKSIFSLIEYDSIDEPLYFILSGPMEINSTIVQISEVNSSVLIAPIHIVTHNSTSKLRKIFQLDISSGLYGVNITIPAGITKFSFSYVWLTFHNVTNHSISKTMTERIRVHGLQWNLINGTFLTIFQEDSSPLVVYCDVYTHNLTYITSFGRSESFTVTKNQTYLVIVWATLRTGDYSIGNTLYHVTDTDPYYNGPADYASGTYGFNHIITLLGLFLILPIKIKRMKKQCEK